MSVEPPAELPGYDLEAPAEPAGRRWLAREAVSRRAVEVTFLPVAPDLVELAGLAAQVRAGPLLPVHAVVPVAAAVAVVTDRAPGGTLAALLASRARLEPGEVVSLGLALAEAVGELHSAGVGHGGIDAETVRLGLDGRPLLMPVSGTLHRPPTGADLAAAAELCQRALGDQAEPRGPVHAAVRAALQQTYAAPADLAAALASSARATPLRLGESPPRPLPPSPARADRPARPRRRRAFVAGLAALVTLLGAVAAGIGWSRRADRPAAVPLPPAAPRAPAADPRTPPPPASSGRPTVDWPAVLRRLDGDRAAAFAALDPGRLTAVDAPGSVALRLDRAALLSLRRRAAAPRGLVWELLAVELVGADPPGVILSVTDRRSGYALVSAGRIVARFGPRGRATWRVRLVPVAGGWRLGEVARS